MGGPGSGRHSDGGGSSSPQSGAGSHSIGMKKQTTKSVKPKYKTKITGGNNPKTWKPTKSSAPLLGGRNRWKK